MVRQWRLAEEAGSTGRTGSLGVGHLDDRILRLHIQTSEAAELPCPAVWAPESWDGSWGLERHTPRFYCWNLNCLTSTSSVFRY